MSDFCSIVIGAEDTEVHFHEYGQVYLARPGGPEYPEIDLEIPYSDPGVAQRWEELKGQIQGFVEFVKGRG